MPRIALGGLSVVLVLLMVVAVGGGRTAAVTATPTPSPTPRTAVAPAATATVGLLPATVEPTQTSAQDADKFAQLRDEALKRPLVYGPADGSLAMQQNNISVDTANVSVRDFAVHVTFTNPTSAAEHNWDYGIVFRITDQHAYQLGVHSSGSWFLAVDTAQPSQSGELTTLNYSANGTNSLDLIAIGSAGYFGVNGTYVATLDLSKNREAGQVGVAAPFFADSYIAGSATAYKDFLIWSFDAGATPEAGGGSPPAPSASPTARATVTPRATAAATAAGSPVAGNSYTSPTYGYSLTWDSGWQEVTQTSQNSYDLLRIASNTALVDLSGFPWTGTADDCIESLVNYYSGQSGYSNVKIAVDANGQARRGHDGTAAWAVIDFTLTSNGQTNDYSDYVECRPIVDGQSMLSFEYVTYASDLASEESERERLLAALVMPGAAPETGTPATASPEATGTEPPEGNRTETPEATAAVSPEATSESALGPIGLTLKEENGSGVSGLATLSEAKEGGQTVVQVLVVGAPAGSVAIIHKGTCADLDPTPAYLLSPIGANGSSETTIDASLRDLRSTKYAIAVYASVGDLSKPIACGEIPTAG
jgi:hypothetical protein